MLPHPMLMSKREPLSLLQAEYWQSPQSFTSAKSLIERKCHNMMHLVQTYLPYQRKQFPDRAPPLHKSVRRIEIIKTEIQAASSRRELLLLEARASKAYWQAVKILTNQPNEWKRIHPGARDPLNRTLNIGYTMLVNLIRAALKEVRLDPQIGLLHSPRANKEALVYDLQELFRQPVVDAAILPLFTRRTDHESVTSKDIVRRVMRRLDRSIWH